MAKILQDAFEAMNRLFGDPSVTAEGRYYDLLDRIAIAVVEYRMEHNLSQKKLAEQLNVSQAMVSKYESGEYNISLKALVELFDRLNMKLDVQFGENSENDEGFLSKETQQPHYHLSYVEQAEQDDIKDELECLAS